MKKYSLIISIIAVVFIVFGCELNEYAVTSIDKKAVFGSEQGLLAYSWSLYEILPTANAIVEAEASQDLDYICTRYPGSFTLLNNVSENTSGGWTQDDWARLRRANYLITNCTDPNVPETVRNNYIGLARFFRAWFYYDMVRSFGDVPWVDHLLNPDETDMLYGPRDSRELVMEKVYEDLVFAAQNITRTTDATQSTLVTQWAAWALASRVCLFEGTFRKYHNLNLATSTQVWLNRAADAANMVIENSGKSLNASYRDLFTLDTPPVSETILAIASNSSVPQHANRYWNLEMYGGSHFIRPFICTYLQKDGTPYTDRTGWEYEDFYEEFQNRDERLKATVRYPGYMREGSLYLPGLSDIARLGYHPMKLCVDATAGDLASGAIDTHAVQLIRYGEVLLNYAEAKAELGTLTDAEWAKTIGALRQRAGITGGLSTKPTVVDNYLKNTYFPDIADPVILEVRRERACELALEGFRFHDIRRWKHGELVKNKFTGMYISGINQPLDIDHNNVDDVIYYTDIAGLAAAEALSNNPNAYKVPVATVASTDPDAPTVIIVSPAGNGSGYHLTWQTENNHLKVWGPKQYLYPIPKSAINLNPTLGQNPGWENGATNDGN